MKRRIYLILFMIAALSLTSFYTQQPIKAENTEDKLRRELQEIEKQVKETQAKTNQINSMVNKAKKQKNQLKNEITFYDLKLNEVAANIDKTEAEIEKTKDRIFELGNLLDEATKRVEARDELIKKRVRAIYETGDVSYLEVLLDSSSIGDFLTRYDLVGKIVDSDLAILKDNLNDKKEIEQNKKETEDLKEQYIAQLDQLNQDKQEYENNMKERSVRVATLEENIDDWYDEIEKADNELSKLAIERTNKQNELNNLTYNGGQFLWPLPDSHRITSGFGVRIHPIKKKKISHNGIDIAAPAGTKIVAAEDGVVILATYYGSYGNCVMINHGNGYVTLYGHIRNGGIKVKEGQEVKRGDKIAEVGSTGQSTGNHLHFSVIKDGEYVSPMKYLK